jgi:hypothetical protein
MKPRIYVDFNTMMMDEKERVSIISTSRGGDELEQLALLKPGASITLYDEELEVEGTVEASESRGSDCVWLVAPDWTTSRDLPGAALSARD